MTCAEGLRIWCEAATRTRLHLPLYVTSCAEGGRPGDTGTLTDFLTIEGMGMLLKAASRMGDVQR
jgi:hypothetical protein